MNFVLFLWILCILLVHFHFVLPMNFEPNEGDAGPSGPNHSSGSKTVEIVDKFPFLHASLEWIFQLVEWLAKNWPNLEKYPDIVELPQMVIEKLKEKSVKGIAEFAEYFREYLPNKVETGGESINYEDEAEAEDDKMKAEKKQAARHNFVHVKYPNTKEMSVWTSLEKILNDVDNTDEEIKNGLKEETREGEDKNDRRGRHKNEFRFAFLVDCIFAAHMEEQGRINWDDISAKLKKPPQGDFIAYPSVGHHPLYAILMANKCDGARVIQTFMYPLLNQFYEDVYYYEDGRLIKQFLYEKVLPAFEDTAMKGKLTKRGPPSPPSLYFPERMPKLDILACLIHTLMDIIICIIKTIIPRSDGSYVKDVEKIFPRAIGRLTDHGRFMYFAIRNGTHFNEALNELPDQIKRKMNKITHEYSFFTYLLDKKKIYNKWSGKTRHVHLIKYVAMHLFGFNAQELPPNPTNGNDFAVYERYYEEIVQGIGIKILKKYVASYKFTGKSEEELLMNEMLPQLKLNVFCVGLQELMANQHNYKNYAKFYHDLKWRDWSSRNTWSHGLLPLLTTTDDLTKVRQILDVVKKDAKEGKVNDWVLKGAKEMYKQFCGPRKVAIQV